MGKKTLLRENSVVVNKKFYKNISYQILKFLGKGGFAEVYLAKKDKSEELYAIKVIKKDDPSK